MSDLNRLFETPPEYLPEEPTRTDALQPTKKATSPTSQQTAPSRTEPQASPQTPQKNHEAPESQRSQQQPHPGPTTQWEHQQQWPQAHRPGPAQPQPQQPEQTPPPVPAPAPRRHEVSELISQLQRPPEVPSTGWRKLLRLGPSKAAEELASDQRLLRTGFVRPIVIMVANPKGGVGKALSIHEPVLTPQGYRPIGDLAVGDLVIGRDGLSYDVLGVFPQGERDLFEVAFSDGTTVLADGDHLWEVQTNADVSATMNTSAMLRAMASGTTFGVATCQPVESSSDGTVFKRHEQLQNALNGGHRIDDERAQVTFTSADEADRMQSVAQSLGCVVIRQGATSLIISASNAFDLYCGNKALATPEDGLRRAVTSITPAGRGEAVCISVASPDHLFLTRNCVPTHNTPTSIGLSAAFGDARGGGVVGWDNNELRGTMGDRTFAEHQMDVVDMITHRDALLQAQTRAADVHRGLHYQSNGQFWVLRSSQVAGHQITDVDFNTVREILSRFFPVIVIDTGNNEVASNWLATAEHADALIVPLAWRKDNLIPAARMLKTLSDEKHDIVNRTIVVGTNGPNDAVADVRSVAHQWFDGYPILEVPTDPHIAEGAEIDWAKLNRGTRRAYQRLGAVTASVIADYLNGEPSHH